MIRLPAFLTVVLLAAACGGDEPAPKTPMATATHPPSVAPAARATAAIPPTATAADREAMRREALEAALWPSNGVDCTKPAGLPAPSQPCVSLVTSPISARAPDGSQRIIFDPQQDPAQGIAVYRVDAPGDDRDFYGIVGAGPVGAWLTLEKFTNAPFFQLQLPGELIACPRGASARIYSTPSPNTAGNPVTGEVRQGQRLQASMFRLIQQGPPGMTNPGWGFYLVMSPVAGWVDSREVVGSFWGACSEKYAFDGTTPASNPPSR